jgi:hypothetical protein
MNKHGLSDTGRKGTPLGVRKGRICNTALRIHVIVPRNCDK